MFQNLKKKIDSLSKNSIRIVANTDGEIRQDENESALREPLGVSVAETSKSKELTDASLKTSPVSYFDDALIPSLSSQDLNVTGDVNSSASQLEASFILPSVPRVSSGSFIGGHPLEEQAPKEFHLEKIAEFARAKDEEIISFTSCSRANLQEEYIRIWDQSHLYKNHLLQTLQAYKEVQSEKEQLQVSLSRAEERHRRQLSELKEQICLDQQAKRDLENNYSLMLDEKDEMIQLLQMKVKLLKDESSEESKGSDLELTQQSVAATEQNVDASAELSELQLKEKVKRLELLLMKCKETIKANKEKIQQLVIDRDAITQLVQEKTNELEAFKKNEDRNCKETLECRIKELLEENEKIKIDSEKRLKDLASGYVHDLATQQEKLLLEHEQKFNKFHAEYQEKIAEIISEKEKLPDVSVNLEENPEALSTSNERLESKTLVKEQETQEVDELKKRISELELMVKFGQVSVSDQKEETAKVVEEKMNLGEKTMELEQIPDSQQDFLSTAEMATICLKNDFVKEKDDLVVKQISYEDEIISLREEVERNSFAGIEKYSLEVTDGGREMQDIQADFQNVHVQKKQKLDGELKVESKESMEYTLQAEGEPMENFITDVNERSREVMLQLEIENHELKEKNKTLIDQIEVSRSMIECYKEEIDLLKADSKIKQEDVSQQLMSSSDVISQLEQRINDSMERENQLNVELETAQIENEQNLTLRNEEITSLQATINQLISSEKALKDSNESQSQEISLLKENRDLLMVSEHALKDAKKKKVPTATLR